MIKDLTPKFKYSYFELYAWLCEFQFTCEFANLFLIHSSILEIA